jgi:hypothetical protein
MRSSYRLTVAAAGVLLAVGLAGPAAADPPRSGSCPTPFTAVNRAQLARAIEEAGAPPQLAADAAAGAFARVDKNGDRVLCYHPIGKTEYVNVIDNVVP